MNWKENREKAAQLLASLKDEGAAYCAGYALSEVVGYSLIAGFRFIAGAEQSWKIWDRVLDDEPAARPMPGKEAA